MKGKTWKNLHKLSYLFYLLVGLHLVFMNNDRIFFYIGIFAVYLITRIWTYFEKKLAKMSAADAEALQNQLAREKDAQTKLLLLQQAADKAQKRSTTNIIIGSAIGLIGLIAAIVVFKKKK
jgi:DMSO/TMAO reductase YedYZ heme-binding membrane subunit